MLLMHRFWGLTESL